MNSKRWWTNSALDAGFSFGFRSFFSSLFSPQLMKALAPQPAFMDLALELAQRALFLTSPNPRVGCVIVSEDGTLLGQGHTQRAGQAHAEVMALQDAQQKGHSVEGATVYVSLEPCSHVGRTPPCCDALIKAKVKAVYMSILDPNPLVSGQGAAQLRAHGIEVHVGLGADRATELNLGFLKRMQHQMPWVRSKIAASLDGHTATDTGVSQWITSAPSRADGHAFRAQSCCTLTGIGTVLADDPSLDVRELCTPRQPDVVILDSSLRIPLDAKILKIQRRTFIYCALEFDPQSQELIYPNTKESLLLRQKVQALQELGVIVKGQPQAQKRIDLQHVCRDLAKEQMNEVHVEAGAVLNGALMENDLIDELLLYMAPTWLGSGRGMSLMQKTQALTQAKHFEWKEITRTGEDLRLILRRK